MRWKSSRQREQERQSDLRMALAALFLILIGAMYSAASLESRASSERAAGNVAGEVSK